MFSYNTYISKKSLPPPKIDTYRIEKDSYPTFELKIKETVTNNSIFYNLTVGKNKNNCINISFHKNIHKNIGKDESHIAEMGWVEHYPECSIDEKLPKGEKGTKHLVRAVFQYIKNTYNWITHINLFDGSYFICENIDSGEKHKVMLAYYNIALYDKTWYEANFNATLNNHVIYNEYNECKKQLTDSNEKLSWEQFIYKYHINENLEIIEKYYNNTNTYRDFFISLKNNDTQRYCWRISKWIQPFMSNIFNNINIDKWLININEVEDYTIDYKLVKTEFEQLYRGGTKRKTQRSKNIKKRKVSPDFNQSEFDLQFNDKWPY